MTMKKKLICIECPKGCVINVSIADGKVSDVSGHDCPRGKTYAIGEILNPVRVLTSTILAKGMGFKMVPVRTNKHIPRKYVMGAMKKIRNARVTKPVKTGDIIIRNLLGLGVNVVATRDLSDAR